MVGHRHLEAVDLGCQNRIPGDLPLTQPVREAYFMLNTSQYYRPCDSTRATLGSRQSQSHFNNAGQTPNTRVDMSLVW